MNTVPFIFGEMSGKGCESIYAVCPAPISVEMDHIKT